MPSVAAAPKTDSSIVEPTLLVDPGTCVSVPNPSRHRSIAAAVLELGKPRITRLVTMTAGVGFVLGAGTGELSHLGWWAVAVSAVGCLIGTALCSAGANALNQWWEYRRDARMRRTMNRPIPAGELSPALGLWAGLCLSLIGAAVLLPTGGLAATAVAVATILIYVLIYTPSKVLTVWNTAIGAVPGALPPLIGWCAAAGLRSTGQPWYGPLSEWGGWSLVGLMAVWQIPHFLALAWMYRDDYQAGGYRMLPAIDPSGRLTAWITLGGAVLLAVTTLWPWSAVESLGLPYAAVALVSGCGFVWMCVRMVTCRACGPEAYRDAARRVFFASIVHLPLLLVAMTAESLMRVLL